MKTILTKGVKYIGKRKKGVQDRTGPHEDSYMSRVLNRKGQKSGHKKGDCK